MPNHDKKDKAGTFVAIWITLILLVGMVPFMPGAHADTSGNIQCAIGVNWYEGYGVWTHNQGYMYPGTTTDRTYFAFNLNSIGSGATISDFHIWFYMTNTMSRGGDLNVHELPVFTNSTYSSTSLGADISQFAATGMTNGDWNTISSSAMTTYAQDEYDAHSGWVYIALSVEDMTFGSGAFGIGGDTNSNPTYVVVTYTGATNPPSFTSSPTTTGTNGVAYSYHITIDQGDAAATFTYLNGPAWLTANANSTVGSSFYLNGTAATGTHYVKLRSNNTYGTVYQNYTLTVSIPPSITSSAVTTATPGVPYSYHLTADQAVTWAIEYSEAGTQYLTYNSTPSDDTILDQANPNTVENLAYLEVNTAGSLYSTMLWTPSLPSGAVIDAVYLHMYKYSESGSGKLNLGPSTNTSWSESTATWNNYVPTWQGGNYHTFTETTSGWCNYTHSDINGWMNSQYQATGKVSFLLTNFDGSSYKNWRSAEYSSASYRPYILLQYHAPILSIDAQGWLNGTFPTTGSYDVNITANNSNGEDYQNFTIVSSYGPPAVYVGVDISDPANNTIFYNDETNKVWWNYTSGTYAFSHYNISESIDNGSTWFYSFNTTSYAPGLSFSPNPSNHYWYMVKIRGVDIHDYAGAYSYICFNFVDPPPLVITSSPVLDGITNVPYSYQLTANISATWSQSPSVVTMAGEEPTADSSIFSYNANANYGALDTLYTYQPTPQSVRAVFLWDSIVIPAGCTITSVVLHLYKTYNAYGGAMEFYGNDNYNWTEMAVTWNNAGTLSLLSGYVVEYSSLGWKSYSTSALSAYCSAQYASSGHITFAMATTNFNAEVYYDSKEGTNHPYLTVTYSNPSFTSINSTTGLLTGTPTSPGTYNVSIEAVHNTQHTWQNFTITVVDGWRPTITSTPSPLIMYIGSTWTYAVTANESVTIAIFGNGHMVGNSVVHAGTNHGWDYYYLEVTSVSGGMVAYQNWSIEWRFSWNPTFTSSPGLTGTGGVAYSYTWTANTSVYFGYVSGPAWASVVGNTVSGTPIVLGPYNFVLRLQNVPGDWVYQNWTLVVTTTHFVMFTSTPVLDADNGSYYHYHVTTNIPATVTITFGPSWLGYSTPLKTLAGNCPSYGVYTVTLHAVSTVYGTQANQTFVITASPIIPPLPIDESILLVIPIFMLAILVLICSWSREEGLSGNIFLGSMAIGVGMLATVNAFPIWTMVIAIGILAIMLFRSVRG